MVRTIFHSTVTFAQTFPEPQTTAFGSFFGSWKREVKRDFLDLRAVANAISISHSAKHVATTTRVSHPNGPSPYDPCFACPNRHFQQEVERRRLPCQLQSPLDRSNGRTCRRVQPLVPAMPFEHALHLVQMIFQARSRRIHGYCRMPCLELGADNRLTCPRLGKILQMKKVQVLKCATFTLCARTERRNNQMRNCQATVSFHQLVFEAW